MKFVRRKMINQLNEINFNTKRLKLKSQLIISQAFLLRCIEMYQSCLQKTIFVFQKNTIPASQSHFINPNKINSSKRLKY